MKNHLYLPGASASNLTNCKRIIYWWISNGAKFSYYYNLIMFLVVIFGYNFFSNTYVQYN